MNESIAFGELVETWSGVRSTAGRLEKRARMAALFARLGSEDLPLAASWLAGEIRQGALQVGWRTLEAAGKPVRDTDLPLFAATAPAAWAHRTSDGDSPLRIADVDATFEKLQHVGGAGSEPRRVALLAALFERATDSEREFLRGLLLGELRQGALRALVLEALATSFTVPVDALRRAVMFAGDFGAVVQSLAHDGAAGLANFGPQVLVPIEPMLAAPAASVAEALQDLGDAALEWKLDGVRIQLHRSGDQVRAFSRRLRDVTPLVPQLVDWARRLPATSFVLDGEVVSRGPDGRPLAFQDLMSRFSRDVEVPPDDPAHLEALWFDLLVLEGVPLLEKPYRDRRTALEALVPESHRVPASTPKDAGEAENFYANALAQGHEGVLVKALDSPYDAGRRGAQWRKIKPAITLDLVILAAEWGHGRRTGKLSNLHLGARIASEPGRFAMLGKTFKGLTDAMLEELTRDLQTIATHSDAFIVHVRPERVVEIAFDSVQRSPRYDSGLALRFARVKHLRPDKSAAEATTLDEVRAIHARQGEGPQT